MIVQPHAIRGAQPERAVGVQSVSTDWMHFGPGASVRQRENI